MPICSSINLSKSIDLEQRTTIDEVILGALKGRELESMGRKNVETLKIEHARTRLRCR